MVFTAPKIVHIKSIRTYIAKAQQVMSLLKAGVDIRSTSCVLPFRGMQQNSRPDPS